MCVGRVLKIYIDNHRIAHWNTILHFRSDWQSTCEYTANGLRDGAYAVEYEGMNYVTVEYKHELEFFVPTGLCFFLNSYWHMVNIRMRILKLCGHNL